MQTNHLQRKNPNMKRVIVARGGKRGKTAGRGGKGQSARAGNKRRPEWRDIIKKLPKLRGRGVNQNKAFAEKPIVINVDVLEAVFNTGDAITPAILIEKGIVSTQSGRVPLMKILGEGEVTKSFKISGLSISESAHDKIKKAGGTVEITASQTASNKASAARLAQANVVPAEAPAKVEKKAKAPKADASAPKAEKKEKKVAPKAVKAK
jgi:large subunit ribosomal protein L15